MSDSTLILHIGMPKAASTYLHSAVFPVLMPGRYLMPGAANARKPEYQFRRNAFSVKRFSDAFHKNRQFWEQHGEEFLRKYLSPFMQDGPDPGSVIVSDEAVARVNHFNIRRMPSAFERDDIQQKFGLFAESAQRIGFNRTRVLLVIRRQDSLLTASYAQLSRKIIGASQKDFEKRIDTLRKRDSRLLENSFYSVDYHELCQSLVSSLGKSNVLVLPLEEFSYDFPNVIKKLSDFAGISESTRLLSQIPKNSRSAGTNKWGLRPLLLFKSPSGNMQITSPRFVTRREKNIELTPDVSRKIMTYYAESNRKLEALLDIDLHRFGYCSV